MHAVFGWSQEAIYEIGICDNGLLLGIDREEMDSSLRTLGSMAEGLGAEVEIVREVQVDGCLESDMQGPPPPLALGGEARNGMGMLGLPNLFHEKKAVTKRQRRQIRRDKDTLAKAVSVQSAQLGHGRNTADLGTFMRGEGGEEVREGEEDRDEDEVGKDRRTSSTPPFDDIPDSSQSPSPNRSKYTITESIDDASSTVSAIPPMQPVSVITMKVECTGSDLDTGTDGQNAGQVLTPEEEECLRVRRHLRKQWKKERKLYRLGRIASTSYASSISTPSTSNVGISAALDSPDNISSHGLPSSSFDTFGASTPEDRFMDGLVGLFDGVVLEDVEPLLEPRSKREKKRTMHVLRKTRTDADVEKAIRIPQVAHIGAGTGKRRFAVECVVYYPEDRSEGTKERLNGEISGQAPTPNFIDFEGLFNAL